MTAAIITKVKKATLLGISVSVAIGLAACSGDGSSPTSPSASLSGGTTTISGTALTEGGAATGQRTSLSPRTFTSLANPSDLQVCVAETNVCVGVGESGTFELNGNLEGDVELHITGRGQDVHVTVNDVLAGETIVVSISLNGDHGSLEVESRRGGASDLVEVCHVRGNGDYQLLEVNESAKQAHLDHGDGIPGETGTNRDPLVEFDDDCDTIGPSIDIEKSTNGEDADRGSGPRIATGAPVEWTYTVINTGNVALIDVMVSDSEEGEVCTEARLEIGGEMTCTLEGTATTGRYSNIGTVTAKAPEGVEVTDSDPSHYVGTGEEDGEEEEGERVELCHLTGNGTYRPITVNIDAVPAHLAHGDGEPGETGTNRDPEVELDDNCAVVNEAAPE